MKKAIALVCTLVVFGALAADRTVTAVDSSIVIYQVAVTPVKDGGCAAQAWGTFNYADGGTSNEATRIVETSGGNRTTCLDILNTKGLLIFKSDRGF